ncbi:MAG: hypothetical protein C4533_05125 [Candidatus Omnitrophota bacterium]|nr:MAG: hypothetical protein C4533_05125 [Candidatus Omnitrophota bacterium]
MMIITGLSLFSSVSKGETDQEAISAVQLTSMVVDTSSGVNHLRMTIKAKRAGNFEGIVDINKAAQKSLEHLFIALTMHDDAFWVNLNPDEPDRIINASLADTDLGRIMLNADYRLKEDVANIINPQSSQVGREFWRRLYQKAEELGAADKIPLVTRLWIVPNLAQVYEKQNQLYITKSSLRVQLEPAYISQRITFKNNREKELQDFTSELMEELVLPQLNKRINEAYGYADLRDVYNALILAHWYKGKFGSGYNSLLQTVNYKVLDDTETDYASTPNEIYQSYLKSIKEGQYSFSETEAFGSPFGMIITTRHYFSGGVDLRDIRLTEISSSPAEETSKDSLLYTCDLLMPRNVERPLQYAKNELSVTSGVNTRDNLSTIMLARSLPAITPVRFSEQNMQSLAVIDKTERVLLSKL